MAEESLLEHANKAFFNAMLAGGIRPLLLAAYEVLKWPVLLGDDASNVLYQMPTVAVGIEDFDYLLKEKRVPSDLYLAFHQKYFSEMNRTNLSTMMIKDGSKEKLPQVLNAIKVDGKTVATVVLHPTKEQLTEEEVAVVTLFCRVLTTEYRKLTSAEKFPTKRKLLNLTNILENQEGSPSAITAANQLSVEMSGSYAVVISLIEGDTSKTLIPSFFCSNAMRVDPHIVSVSFEGNIVTLCGDIKESHYSNEYPPVVRRVIELSQQCSLPTGVTTFFSNLSDIKSYYQQALLTARIGCKLKPEKAVYDFFEFAPLQAFIPAIRDYNLNTFLHPMILDMMAWDSKYQTEYLKTLRAYLFSGRNNKTTAQTLSVHQNTLLYRITKIKELFSADFSDTKLTLTLLCNLMMLEIARPDVFT